MLFGLTLGVLFLPIKIYVDTKVFGFDYETIVIIKILNITVYKKRIGKSKKKHKNVLPYVISFLRSSKVTIEGEFGIENRADLTAIIVGITRGIRNCNIIPIYNKNVIDIKVDCIICGTFANIIFKMIKIWRKANGKDRKCYANYT